MTTIKHRVVEEKKTRKVKRLIQKAAAKESRVEGAVDDRVVPVVRYGKHPGAARHQTAAGVTKAHPIGTKQTRRAANKRARASRKANHGRH